MYYQVLRQPLQKQAAVCWSPLIVGTVPGAGGVPLLLHDFNKGDKPIISVS